MSLQMATLTLRENIFIQKTEVVFLDIISVWKLLEGVWTCTWPLITQPPCLEQLYFLSSAEGSYLVLVLTYQSLGCLYQKLPVYFVVFLVFMIINITGTVITFPHAASISSYKYPDPAGCLTNPGWAACLYHEAPRLGEKLGTPRCSPSRTWRGPTWGSWRGPPAPWGSVGRPVIPGEFSGEN